MAKISSYNNVSSPSVTDLLIGTDVVADNKTKNFKIEDVGKALGLPYRVTKTFTAAELLTVGSGLIVLGAVGANKLISIDSLYISLNAVTTVFDIATSLGFSNDWNGGSPYCKRGFGLPQATFNSATTVKTKTEPNYLTAGNPLVESGGVFLGSNGGANPTQGNGTLTVTAFYRLFDANMIPITS